MTTGDDWEPIGGGFPPRHLDRVRVDSLAEEDAYLAAYGASAEVPVHALAIEGDEAITRVTCADGRGATLFDRTSFLGGPGVPRLGGFTTELLDHWMRAAADFARENGPAHPGSLPRYPLPSGRYPGKIDVPMAVLAVEQGRRGLYAPPRVVTIDYPTGEPYGVGEYPGFTPSDWPPRRLGDWPPAGLIDLAPDRLQGMVARFSACAARLMDGWLAGRHYAQRNDEAFEMLGLLGVLCLPRMMTFYEHLNPEYWAWLRSSATGASRTARLT